MAHSWILHPMQVNLCSFSRAVRLRYEIEPADPGGIRCLVERTGMFHPNEVDVAEELVHEGLASGDASGYRFVLAEHRGRLVGYVCYGPIACTQSSFDIHWIAVDPDSQGKGLGRRLAWEAERLIRKAGGTRIYVETSQSQQYTGTRAFYSINGYRAESILDHFYGPDDAKITYCKILH